MDDAAYRRALDAAYRRALEVKAFRVKQLAGRICQATDSSLVLDLSIKLRRTTQEMRALVHEHIVAQRAANRTRAAQEAAPPAAGPEAGA